MIYLSCICMAFCAEERIFYAIGEKRAPSEALFSVLGKKYCAKQILSRYVRTQTRTQTSTARFAIARHGTAVNPSRRLSVSNL